ncbi:MAG: hypothetical protein CL943_01715 [Candidatus Diapherotrites archaeon]|uniref:Archease domain-containing protein n=1 Tax=Candidatus Iainarchaeum sp. TaxID=3101447 RepID=A0A2D6M0R1_9ARCH|nr:hypothetical protein [Candidatus Diapherotrites archaeon]
MDKYLFLEHTADALFQAFGENFEELLLNSAEAMLSVIYDVASVETKKSVKVNASGDNKEELLHNFLEAVHLELELKEMVFGKIEITHLDEAKNTLEAELHGEKMDRKKHNLKTEIKAVTWHSFFVRKEENKWISQVLVDI